MEFIKITKGLNKQIIQEDKTDLLFEELVHIDQNKIKEINVLLSNNIHDLNAQLANICHTIWNMFDCNIYYFKDIDCDLGVFRKNLLHFSCVIDLKIKNKVNHRLTYTKELLHSFIANTPVYPLEIDDANLTYLHNDDELKHNLETFLNLDYVNKEACEKFIELFEGNSFESDDIIMQVIQIGQLFAQESFKEMKEEYAKLAFAIAHQKFNQTNDIEQKEQCIAIMGNIYDLYYDQIFIQYDYENTLKLYQLHPCFENFKRYQSAFISKSLTYLFDYQVDSITDEKSELINELLSNQRMIVDLEKSIANYSILLYLIHRVSHFYKKCNMKERQLKYIEQMKEVCDEAIQDKEDPKYKELMKNYYQELALYQYEENHYEEAFANYMMYAKYIEDELKQDLSVYELDYIAGVFETIADCCDKLENYLLKLKYAWKALLISERSFKLAGLSWNDLYDNPHWLDTSIVIKTILQLELPLKGTKEALEMIDGLHQEEMPTTCFLKICPIIKELI